MDMTINISLIYNIKYQCPNLKILNPLPPSVTWCHKILKFKNYVFDFSGCITSLPWSHIHCQILRHPVPRPYVTSFLNDTQPTGKTVTSFNLLESITHIPTLSHAGNISKADILNFSFQNHYQELVHVRVSTSVLISSMTKLVYELP